MRPADFVNAAATIRIWTLAKPRPEVNPDWQAGLLSWVVEADPGVLSAAFTHWYGAVIHLRDVPGQTKPAHRWRPEYEYEIMSYTIDPSVPNNWPAHFDAQVQGRSVAASGFLLQPPDIVYQWGGTTDAQAIEVAEALLRAIRDGLSIDRPVDLLGALRFDAEWAQRLGATVEHFTRGHG